MTKSLPVYEVDDPDGEPYHCLNEVRTYVEASNSVRLRELLRREHYRPVAAVKHHDGRGVCIRVYFLALHRAELSGEQNEPIDPIENLLESTGVKQERQPQHATEVCLKQIPSVVPPSTIHVTSGVDGSTDDGKIEEVTPHYVTNQHLTKES